MTEDPAVWITKLLKLQKRIEMQGIVIENTHLLMHFLNKNQ